MPQQFQTLPVATFLNSAQTITVANNNANSNVQQQLSSFAAFNPHQTIQFQAQPQHFAQLMQQPQQTNQFGQYYAPQAQLQPKPMMPEYANLVSGPGFNAQTATVTPQVYMNPQQIYYYYYQQQQQQQMQMQQQQMPVQSVILQPTPLNAQKFASPSGNT